MLWFNDTQTAPIITQTEGSTAFPNLRNDFLTLTSELPQPAFDVTDSRNATTPTPMMDEDLLGMFAKSARSPAVTFVLIYGIGCCLWGGTVGNLFSVIVMLQARIRGSTTAAFLIALAAADTLTLWAVNQRMWFVSVVGRPLVEDTCNVMFATQMMARVWSSWCLVCVTVERFVAVRFPFKIKTSDIFKVSRVRIGMAVLPVVIFLIIGLPNFLASRQVGNMCEVNRGFELFVFSVNAPYLAVLGTAIPDVVMMTLNVMIAHELRRTEANMRLGVAASTTVDMRKKETRRITVTILTVSTAHLVLTLPFDLYHIATDPSIAGKLVIRSPTMALVQVTLEVIAYLNHSINFFLYVITSRQFRGALVALFECGRKPDGQRRRAGEGQLNIKNPNPTSQSNPAKGTSTVE